MDVRAAVAYAAGKPLEVTTVTLEGPKRGEVLVELKATGICHTDEFTLSGADPEGLFPAILGHVARLRTTLGTDEIVIGDLMLCEISGLGNRTRSSRSGGSAPPLRNHASLRAAIPRSTCL